MYNIGTSLNSSLDLNNFIENTGKTYLHCAVENKAKEIISYLLFDIKADPNKLTLETEMGALHLAVQN